jgi:hypothetical protein
MALTCWECRNPNIKVVFDYGPGGTAACARHVNRVLKFILTEKSGVMAFKPVAWYNFLTVRDGVSPMAARRARVVT